MTEFEKQYDVIVVGLGTAGAVALIKAAKKGLRVLGIENLSRMGGTSTAGGISHYYYGLDGGYYTELDREADNIRDIICDGCTASRTDISAYVFENKALGYGADIMYDTAVVGVYKTANRVCGVKCLKNGKEYKYASKILIDATGDGQICKMSGCLMQGGRNSDNQMQPYANILMVLQDKNVYGINKDAGYINQTENSDFSAKILDSSAFLYHICNEYRGRLSFVSNAMLTGCREGERIVGEENITFEGCTEGKDTEKTVFYAFSNIDSHSKDIAFENRNTKDWYIAAGLWGAGIRCAVPMGALIPKGFDGIIAAGRCIASEHEVSACIRMMRDMKKCGEVAAEIAYLAITDNVRTVDVDYEKLSEELIKSGCLMKSQNCGFAHRTRNMQVNKEFEWLTDTEKITEELSGDSPGVAIWSAKRMGEKIRDKLIAVLDSKNRNLQVNAAFALALIGDKSGVGILRELVKERNIHIPQSSIKFTYAWGVSAAYLLGRLCDTASADLLLDVLEEDGAFDEEQFVKDELHQGIADMRFMFISNAVAALSEICSVCDEEKRKYILERIKNKISSGYDIKICLKDNPYIEYNMLDILKRQMQLYIKMEG